MDIIESTQSFVKSELKDEESQNYPGSHEFQYSEIKSSTFDNSMIHTEENCQEKGTCNQIKVEWDSVVEPKNFGESSCQNCFEKFPSQELLSIHMEKCSMQSNDAVSTDAFQTEGTCNQVKVEWNSVVEPKNFGESACQNCLEKFPSQELLSIHMEKCSMQSNDAVSTDAFQTEGNVKEITAEIPRVSNHEKFVCIFCGKSYDFKHHLKVHILMHKNRRFECRFCKKSFWQKGVLTSHLMVHTPPTNYQCDVCGKTFHRSRYFKAHTWTHVDKEVVRSVVSNPPVQSDRILRHRVPIYTKQAHFQCDVCRRSFSRNQLLKKHMQVHNNTKAYEYNKSVPKRRNSRRSARANKKKRPYKCAVCSKTFAVSSTFNEHMRRHTDARPFKCAVCPKSFTQKGQLTGHMQIHSNVRPYACSVCKKTFKRNSHLKKHLYIHTKEKPFKCDVCTKSFAQKEHLKRHTLVHTREKSFRCNVCREYFAQGEDLNEHMSVHSQEMPFKCEICYKSFSENRKLKSHMPIHINEKAFQCNICKQFFRRNSNLVRHMRVHTNEKHFECVICHKYFTRNENLKKHSLVQHGGKGLLPTQVLFLDNFSETGSTNCKGD